MSESCWRLADACQRRQAKTAEEISMRSVGGGEEFELTGFEVGGGEEALDEDEEVLGFGADEVEFVGVRLALAEGGAGGRQGGEYCRGARGCRGRRRR